MNKKRVSAQFLLYFLSMMFLMVIGCSSSGSGLLITYNISGTVTGAANVTITLTGPSPGSTTTDASGNYSFKGVDGTYTVVPSKTGYEFNPISQVVVVKDADVAVPPFAATSIGNTPTYTISGTVTGASDVILTLTGDKTGAVATHPDGTYSFPAVENGSYTLVPSKIGYEFNPISSAVTVSGADIPDNNFAATYIGSTPTYTISGTVTGAVLKGVKITLIGDENGSVATVLNPDGIHGNYSFPPVVNGTYTVVPSMAGYTFSPISRVVVVNGDNITVPNFLAGVYTGSTYTISGTVTGPKPKGVTITLGGAQTGAVVTDSNGFYSFSPLPGGSSYNYTVKPYLKGYSFTPYNHIITLTNDSPNNNFVETLGAYTQVDLVGKWNLHMLKAGTKNIWARRILTFAASSDDNLSAVLTSASSCKDSSGSTACPLTTTTADPNNADPSKRTYPLTWKINPSTGEITESGTNALTANHLTMSSNKNFIAGTDGDMNVEKQVKLMIAQKFVEGISYNSGKFVGGTFLQGDAQNDTFVYHQFSVGADNIWSHGQGSTIMGTVSTLSEVDPSGVVSPGDWGTLSVDSTSTVTAGVVTMSGADMANFNGFLSDDKKTIVGTYTDNGSYRLIVIQITDRSDYPVGVLPAGTMFDHLLAIGADVPFWAHATVTSDGFGTMSFGNWVCSASSISGPAAVTLTINASGGVVTNVPNGPEPDFDGQVSDDGLFMISTQTLSTGVYSLSVHTQ